MGGRQFLIAVAVGAALGAAALTMAWLARRGRARRPEPKPMVWWGWLAMGVMWSAIAFVARGSPEHLIFFGVLAAALLGRGAVLFYRGRVKFGLGSLFVATALMACVMALYVPVGADGLALLVCQAAALVVVAAGAWGASGEDGAGGGGRG